MSEAHDFNEIAQDCLLQPDDDSGRRHVADQLRLVWNARGAADLTALEPIIGKLGDTMDPDNARVFVGDAVRTVDR